jgi:hypothetical protein
MASVAWAVYAPVPEQDQGKALSYRLSASAYYDSNLFGAAVGAIDTWVFNFTPAISFNGSVTDQTFVSAGYALGIDHMPDRPTQHTLFSHTVNGRFAHAFSQSTNIDFTEIFMVQKNPESLLAGIPLNTDQSFKRNEFNARFTTTLNPKTGAVVKYRNVVFDFDKAVLGTRLDRMEHLAGAETSYAFLPETKLVGEYRFQAIYYRNTGGEKDKRSHFALGGVDHAVGEKLTLSGRLGGEDRRRAGERSTLAPYAELTASYKYSKDSFVTGGYTYTLEEASDVVRFTDTRVNRFFATAQHALTATITVSGSLIYEPSQLQARRRLTNIDEDTTRLGLALIWLPTKNWAVSASFDHDRTASDDPNRNQRRDRYGVSARFSF